MGAVAARVGGVERWGARLGLPQLETRVAAVLASGLAAVALLVFLTNPVPWEDAAILFRYSENVAAGQGIVYNPGQAPVDGATDMLFMLSLAAFRVLGVPVEAAAAVLNALSVGLTGFLVYVCWRRWARVPVIVALLPVAVVLAGPIWQFGRLGFGTPTFAAVCVVVALVSELATRHPGRRSQVLLGVLIGLAGLVRPEGFILGGLVAAAQALRTRSWRFLLWPAAVSLSVAIAFVAWRTMYFGYPFPNPFYKKGGGTLHPEAAMAMVEFVRTAGLPVLAALAAGLLLRSSRRRAVSLVAVLLGWTAAWLLMSDEMNLSFRFQYPVLPVLVLLSAPLYDEIRRDIRRLPALSAVLIMTFGAISTIVGLVSAVDHFLRPETAIVLAQMSAPDELRRANPQAQVAAVLRSHTDGRRRTVASTEAGYVAWKSGWAVTDLWGLNDKQIAHHGYLTADDLRRLSPELVFAHLPTSNREQSSEAYASIFLPGWTGMTEPLLCFVHRQGYVLLGQWGEPWTFVVLARPDLPDLTALKSQFASVRVGDSTNLAQEGALPAPRGCG